MIGFQQRQRNDRIMNQIQLSSIRLDADGPLHRESPRPVELRQAGYDAAFDTHTLFYDVYRHEGHIVFQGPPLLNLFEQVRNSLPFRSAFRPIFPWARHVHAEKRGEIWLRSTSDHIVIDGPIGHHEMPVQPSLNHIYENRRVLLTVSKNNPIRWISDWIAFHASEHGADAALIYDNGSSCYTPADLQSALRAVFPQMVIHVLSWPFPYGPQGGATGSINGIETPWDSDFCQVGALQHARFRCLSMARSVLQIDVDELVLSSSCQSVFAATEASPSGFLKFGGRWISPIICTETAPNDARHGDFWMEMPDSTDRCTPKWCIVPSRFKFLKISWSVHNLFGTRHNRHISPAFEFRHLRAISTNWKEQRWPDTSISATELYPDIPLKKAYVRAGLVRAN